MANNYTQFSFTVPATTEQADWLETTIQACHDYQNGDEREEEFDQVVFRICEGDLFPDVEIEFGDGLLWFHADENGDIEFTANAIHEMLAKFDRKDKIGFTWSQSCSLMRVGEFSGGAVFITNEVVEYMSAGSWLADRGVLWNNAGLEAPR